MDGSSTSEGCPKTPTESTTLELQVLDSPLDSSMWLRPGEPGFTLEQRIDFLKKQYSNYVALIKDLETTGIPAQFYQNGQPIQLAEVGPSKGPIMPGMLVSCNATRCVASSRDESSLPLFDHDLSMRLIPPPMPRPGEPGFAPLPDYTPTLEQRIGVLRFAQNLPENKEQNSNYLALIKDLETTGTAAQFYQDGQPIQLAEFDRSKGPMLAGMLVARTATTRCVASSRDESSLPLFDHDLSMRLIPPMPGPREPGFAPLPDYIPTLEQRIGVLKKQNSNFLALIKDLETTGIPAQFYQNGQPIQLAEFDSPKGPMLAGTIGHQYHNTTTPCVASSRDESTLPVFDPYLDDLSMCLMPPPGGYPPPMPRPGEPGFAPLPANPTHTTLEQRIGVLQFYANLPENKKQNSNYVALIKDLETTGTAAQFYQDGQPIEWAELDLSKGPMLPGMLVFRNATPCVASSRDESTLPVFDPYLDDLSMCLMPPPGGYPPPMPRPGEPGFAPLPANTTTLEQRIGLFRTALNFPENQKQKSNILAIIRDVEATGAPAQFYQDGQPIEWAEFDPSKGPIMPGMLFAAAQFSATSAIFPGGGIGVGNSVHLEFRLHPDYSPSGLHLFVQARADSGSDLFTLFPQDAQHLQLNDAYGGLLGLVPVATANGDVTRCVVMLQARVWNAAWTQTVGDWFTEYCVITPPIQTRLTGTGFQAAVYQAFTPEYPTCLVVASHKTILTSMLPTVHRW
ncbi:uncharacterized protein DFL_004310 [Arthrobotrys flagrans]|uniref:Uncharacterized protein n=1 Tax=Arthrobotrys flagrans TaxID=97331 RepID=A0A437A4D5_ARTFL|nr:hypothetical protein DFL_004310 [Arthrobotrys flagrans]